MDYKPFLDKIGENSTAEECVHVMVDCTGALMDELHSSVGPIPSMFLPNVIAVLDRLKSIYLIDADDEEKEKIQRMANALNSALQVTVQVERTNRRDME